MKVLPVNQTSFTSTIEIVDDLQFRKITDGMRNYSKCENITEFDIIPPDNVIADYKTDKKFLGYRLNPKMAYTQEVRTCAAGAFINDTYPKSANLFFHLTNDKSNFEHLDELAPFMHGENAIIVGGKSIGNSHSFIDKIIDVATNKNIPTTYFKGLPLLGEIDFAFNAVKNTAYMCVKTHIHPFLGNVSYAKTFADLKYIFQEIHISPKDKLKFYA